MKQSETLTPCRFDDKDIMVDYDLWEYLLNDTSSCVCNNAMKALFFIQTYQGGMDFKACIPAHQWNKIIVVSLHDNGTMWLEEVKEIKKLFMQWNNETDTDIYVQCEPLQDYQGRYEALTFKFYHTSPDLQ